jgi:hypothetical protein
MRIISHHFSQNTCDTDGSQTQPYVIVKKTRGFLFVSPGPTKANKKENQTTLCKNRAKWITPKTGFKTSKRTIQVIIIP